MGPSQEREYNCPIRCQRAEGIFYRMNWAKHRNCPEGEEWKQTERAEQHRWSRRLALPHLSHNVSPISDCITKNMRLGRRALAARVVRTLIGQDYLIDPMDGTF